MKKIFTLFTAVCVAAFSFGQSYGILVNGKTYYAGTLNPSPGDPSFNEYMVLGVSLNAGDQCQLYDADNKAAWVVTLDSYSTPDITMGEGSYVIGKTACYDFYIKLKYGEDQLYVGGDASCSGITGVEVGSGEQGGGEQGGGGQGGATVEGNPRYYYKGYIDGEDVEPTDATLFTHGTASLTVTSDAYLFVLYQVDGVAGEQYMTATYVDGPTHATLLKTDGEKFHITAGNYTLYLYDNGDGTLEISTQQMAGKKLADPQSAQGIEDVKSAEKARKVIIDGQLRILRGDKIFDATGACLN